MQPKITSDQISVQLDQLSDVEIQNPSEGQSLRFINGQWQNATNTESQPLSETTLTTNDDSIDARKEQSVNVINQRAEKARLRYITKGEGQSMVYFEKSEEAVDFITAGYPSDLTGYPFIEAEINATEHSATQVADNIIKARTQWVSIATTIEQFRLSGKKLIKNATTIDQVDQFTLQTSSQLDAL